MPVCRGLLGVSVVVVVGVLFLMPTCFPALPTNTDTRTNTIHNIVNIARTTLLPAALQIDVGSPSIGGLRTSPAPLGAGAASSRTPGLGALGQIHADVSSLGGSAGQPPGDRAGVQRLPESHYYVSLRKVQVYLDNLLLHRDNLFISQSDAKASYKVSKKEAAEEENVGLLTHKLSDTITYYYYHPVDHNTPLPPPSDNNDAGHRSPPPESPSSPSPSSPQRPLVLLLPWLGARREPLAKYRDLYLARGMDVLAAESSVWHFLWPRWGLAYGLALLRGYTFSMMLCHVAQDPERYARLTQRITGQVFDSLVVGTLEHMATGEEEEGGGWRVEEEEEEEGSHQCVAVSTERVPDHQAVETCPVILWVRRAVSLGVLGHHVHAPARYRSRYLARASRLAPSQGRSSTRGGCGEDGDGVRVHARTPANVPYLLAASVAHTEVALYDRPPRARISASTAQLHAPPSTIFFIHCDDGRPL
ncbi:hypothetical protein CRUP_024645 [Coryphaenoides rupestris]|nr:hypothetical protein CRUP_024645 [Coryphaenoides rupestris]